MTTREQLEAKALRSCSGCAAYRPDPSGPCIVCGSLQTLLMGPGARRAVAENYQRRVEAQAIPVQQAPMSAEARHAEMEQLFGEELK